MLHLKLESKNAELLRHQIPISKDQKRDLIRQVQGKSTKETEKLLSSTFPEVCNEKEKIRDINNNKVEIKVILDKDSQQKLEALKKLLSHKNPNREVIRKNIKIVELNRKSPQAAFPI